MNVAFIAAAIEEDFKNFLIACEYLQINPTQAYDQKWIDERVEYMLSLWGDCEDKKLLQKLDKKMKWFAKNYKTFTKTGFLGY